MSSWPGASYRDVPRSSPTWSIRQPLANWMREEGARAAGKRVLDVGCGVKPYYPWFAQASEYVGVDVQENPHADLHGAVEALPVADASFDVVLATQLLEHVDDPPAAVRELHRVAASGGRVLASTHGVMVYHPNPVDHWRWTHTGLRRLFEGAGEWSSIRVDPCAGTTATLGFLFAEYVHLLAKRAGVEALARPLVAAANTAAAAIDARVTALRELQPGALIANFHVTAVRA
ncbi:MAG TPA: class I SAM-dependent methyltransferase [Gaiellaceae bacterium]|nr:class I SAM-dependent methyltransferase [Gaiellaceae bacterium]